jgi:Fe-S-cluster containining protein
MNDRLNLEEYGLGHLKGKNALFIGESDITKYLDALGKEDISIHLSIPPTPENISLLLAQSNCRRCGKCCMPNPLNPKHPGVEIFESELKPIAKYLGVSPKKLKNKTTKGKLINNPLQPTGSEMTRRFPLPCLFFDSKLKQCRVYPVRPVVCKIYPVLSAETFSYIEVKVNCDYGKDVVRDAIKVLREQRPGLQMLL